MGDNSSRMYPVQNNICQITRKYTAAGFTGKKAKRIKSSG
jgi:hypothetical protein